MVETFQMKVRDQDRRVVCWLNVYGNPGLDPCLPHFQLSCDTVGSFPFAIMTIFFGYRLLSNIYPSMTVWWQQASPLLLVVFCFWTVFFTFFVYACTDRSNLLLSFSLPLFNTLSFPPLLSPFLYFLSKEKKNMPFVETLILFVFFFCCSFWGEYAW